MVKLFLKIKQNLNKLFDSELINLKSLDMGIMLFNGLIGL
jgi:hypothetical protein